MDPMDPVAAKLLIRLVMKSLNENALMMLFAESSTLRQVHIIRSALDLSFPEAKQIWMALRAIR